MNDLGARHSPGESAEGFCSGTARAAPRTEAGSEPECEVRAPLCFERELFRRWKVTGIVVRRGQTDEDGLTLHEVRAVIIEGPGHEAGRALVRRPETQHGLDNGRRGDISCGERLPDVGPLSTDTIIPTWLIVGSRPAESRVATRTRATVSGSELRDIASATKVRMSSVGCCSRSCSAVRAYA